MWARAGQAVGDVGEGAGEAVGNLDELVAGIAGGVGGQNGGGSVDELAEGAGDLGVSAGDIAKIATKLAAHGLRSAVTKEAEGLRVAASRKAKEVGDRRRERKAEDANATPAAVDAAEELDVDIEAVEGTGAEAASRSPTYARPLARRDRDARGRPAGRSRRGGRSGRPGETTALQEKPRVDVETRSSVEVHPELADG